MKKVIIILCTLFMGCSVAKGQESRVEKTISLTTLRNEEKPNNEALKSYLKSRKNTEMLNPDKFNGLTYKFGSIFFQINADTGTFATNRLEKFKMAQDNLNSQIPDQKYFSELKTINNNKVVLIKTEKSDFYYYRFMSINYRNNKVVFATMEYNKVDETKAKKILDFFLKNLKFK